jgi:hypothetical protein
MDVASIAVFLIVATQPVPSTRRRSLNVYRSLQQ